MSLQVWSRVPERLPREVMAMRIARELGDGFYVNLGIGLPTLVANFLPPDRTIFLQSENGVLGVGPAPAEGEADPDLVNAGGLPVTLLPGGCFFSSPDSFAMIRGGHIDLAVLGAFQVSEQGDLANWMLPERGVGSIGGAADLVCGAKRVIVAMEHTTRDGQPRVVRRCSYPLTGRGVVDTIVTDVAVIAVTPEGLLLRELAPGWTAAAVQALTEPRLRLAPNLKEMEL